MTRKTTVVLLNLTKINDRKSGKNEYDRKVTKINVVILVMLDVTDVIFTIHIMQAMSVYECNRMSVFMR